MLKHIAAVALLKGVYGGKPEVITELVDEVYIQHSDAEDGRDALSLGDQRPGRRLAE